MPSVDANRNDLDNLSATRDETKEQNKILQTFFSFPTYVFCLFFIKAFKQQCMSKAEKLRQRSVLYFAAYSELSKILLIWI